ncbi:MAG TPA: HAD family hydrolase [Sphingopyxis sp.]|nr:HAD family hydrolase [Sphingopyxis sp.]
MTRPLLITDCDEVLLHMVVPFAQWVDEAHGVLFQMEDASFAGALKRKECGTPLEAAEVWPLLDGFFTTEMGRQLPVAGAVEAMRKISQVADIIILTNVGPEHEAARTAQLAAVGIDAPVIGNRGPKGGPVRDIMTKHQPSLAIFVDDLGQHHHSVAQEAPDVWRLHMVGEPMIADKIKPARHAHARIDDWDAACAWILDRVADNQPAPAPAPEQV